MQFLAQKMCVLLATQAIFLILGFSQANADDAMVNEVRPKKIIYQMNIDKFIDKNIDAIRDLMEQLEPLKLDNIEFPLMKGVYTILNNGWAQNLANLNRTGNCNIQYVNKKLDIDLNFEWEELIYDYTYRVNVGWVKFKGDLTGRMHKIQANIALQIDFKNYQFFLKKLELKDKGTIDITVTGQLLDNIYNMLIKVVTRIFRTVTLNTIREETKEMMERRIDYLNIKLASKITISEKLSNFANILKLVDYEDLELVYKAIQNDIRNNDN